MKQDKKAALYTLLSIMGLILLSSAIYLSLGRGKAGTAQVIVADALFFLVFSVTAMVYALKINLKKDFYSYLNIELIGSTLFFMVLIADLAAYFVSCYSLGDTSVEYIFQRILDFPERFSDYALVFILAVSVLIGVSNISLMIHEKPCLHNALSLLLSGFYIAGSITVHFVSEYIEKYVLIPKGYFENPLFLAIHTMIPAFFLLLLSYFECVGIGSAILGWLATKKIPRYDKDFIIILGCSIDKRGGLPPLLRGRVDKAIRFAWDQERTSGKPLKYIPSGGQGSNEIISEGSAMEMYLLSHGAESDEIIPEKASTSTHENFAFSKKIIDRINPKANVAFATTNYHVLRSGILAKEMGIEAEGIASKTKWYFWPNGFLREFFAILVMNVKSHVNMAVLLAVLCLVLGTAGYFVGF